MIRSAFIALTLTVVTILVGLPLLVYAMISGNANPLVPRRRRGHGMDLPRGRDAHARGGPRKYSAGACLFAANHTSNADGPAIVGAIPRRIAILAKKSLFAIPIVGPAFRIAHFVPVDRSNAERALAAIDEAVMHMKNGLSFLIYPEGTRSADGRLRRSATALSCWPSRRASPWCPWRAAEPIAYWRRVLIAFAPAKCWCASVRRSTPRTIRWTDAANSPNAYTTPLAAAPAPRPAAPGHRLPAGLGSCVPQFRGAGKANTCADLLRP